MLHIGTKDCAQRCFKRLCGGEVDQLQLDAGELKQALRMLNYEKYYTRLLRQTVLLSQNQPENTGTVEVL